MCVCVRACVRACVCVYVCERERNDICVCVCVPVNESEREHDICVYAMSWCKCVYKGLSATVDKCTQARPRK